MNNEPHALRDLGHGIWLDRAPVSFIGLQLTAETTIVRLADGSVLVHAPGPLTEDRVAAVEAVGAVSEIYVPNLFHHMYARQWADRFPDARVHAPDGIGAKQSELRIDRRLGQPLPAELGGEFDEVVIDGCRLGESVLVHHPSQTLVVTDLVSNIGRPEHWWTAAYTKFSKFYDAVALSRVLQWTSFNDKTAARQSVERVLEMPFERITVGHGDPIMKDAREQLREAYTFLPG